jgi:ribosomal protein S27AE
MQGVGGEYRHGNDVLSWVQRLSPRATLPLQLAALFHDIDRVVTPGKGGGFRGNRNSAAYALHKKQHAQRSAVFIGPRLREIGFVSRVVERALFLIRHHDDTGEEVEVLRDPDLNTLVAADTFAFFTSIAPKLYATEGEARLRDKVRFMVDKLPDDARLLLWRSRLRNSVFERIKAEILWEYYRTKSENAASSSKYRFCPCCSLQLTRLTLQQHRRLLRCLRCGFVVVLQT